MPKLANSLIITDRSPKRLSVEVSKMTMVTDRSANSWFSELGMEDPFSSDQYDIMDFLNEDFAALGEDLQISSLSPTGNPCSSAFIPSSNSTTTLCASATEVPPVGVERPAKQRKPNNYNSSTTQNAPSARRAASTPIILTFGNTQETNPKQGTAGSLNPDDDSVSTEVLNAQGSPGNPDEAAAKTTKSKKKTGGRVRPASQTYDHIIAERKRREQLSQHFVALSAIVPGLKKMDKTSVLGDAITYLKHLQERAKTLEEQTTKQTMESVVLIKKSQVLVEDEGSSDEMNGGPEEQLLPEIEAKVCDKTILLRVHCEKKKGVLVNILSEVEKLNLAVTNTSVASFGSLALDITIIAEMEKESKISMEELIQALRSALRRPNQED